MKFLRTNALTVLVLSAACARAPAPEAPAPASEREALPPIPEVRGALAIDVVYPPENAAVTVSDSTFIFGSTGNGAARLTINGDSVRVEPNGSFIGYLPVPADGVYHLQASVDGQSAAVERKVRVPAASAPMRNEDRLVIGSITPTGAITALRGEAIEVSFRGNSGGTATLVLPGGARVPLVEQRRSASADRVFVVNPANAPASPGARSTYRGFFAARPLSVQDTAVASPRLARIAKDTTTTGAYVELALGGDTIRQPLQLNLAVLEPGAPRVGVAADPTPVSGTNDGYVVGRPFPATTSYWFWENGTEFVITGERGGDFRVQLTPELSAWVAADEVNLAPQGAPAPASLIGSVRLAPAPGWMDARINMSRRLPYQVDVDAHRIVLTVFGGTSSTDWLFYGSDDPMVDRANWAQVRDRVYTLTLDLSRPVWGYRVFWAENGDLILRVRRPPAIDPANPLRGLRITLDPGHGPPEGRFGPTRLTEADANLAIAQHLQRLLQEAGAQVQMTRTDASAVGLYERPAMAVRENADLFVSIHNNALPDGVNPFTNNGTSVYYFHPNSIDLARDLQQEIVREFGLRDLGFGKSSLAVVRWSAWFPSALSESFFFMLPDQEAALRDPSVQERLARAHLRALQRFVVEHARGGAAIGE